MTATFGDGKTSNAVLTTDPKGPFSKLTPLADSFQKMPQIHWNIFCWLCEINLLREKPHQNQREDGKGCTAVSEIALFIDSKLLDQPDPLVKLHSKINPKSPFPAFCCKELQAQIPKALRRGSLNISYGKYTQNNFLGHYSRKIMLSAVIRKQGERLEIFM